MSSRFAIAATLAFLAAALPTNATAEKPEAMAAAESAADENPFEDVGRDAPAPVPPTPAAANGSSTHATRTIDELVDAAEQTPLLVRKPYVTVLVTGSGTGDVAYLIDCLPDATVGNILRKARYPHPIKFDSVKIAVHRPRHHVNEDLTIEAEERILRVEWDAKANQPTKKTNHRLQPGDRLIVRLPPTSVPAPQPPTPIPAGEYYTPYPPPVPVRAAPPILAATPQPYVHEAPHAVVYSALPAPVPSPFSPAEATRATAPVFGGVKPAIVAEPVADHPSTVRFDVVVVEDVDNSFAEFEQLRSRMPFMLTDTATIQGTLRILEKHKLVRRVSAPKLMVLAGEKATIQIGAESPNKEEPWQGLKAEVGARELGGGLAVEFSFKNTTGRQTNGVQTSLIVPHGQTVVMKTGSQLVHTDDEDAAQDTAEHAVYVVLTPEIVR